MAPSSNSSKRLTAFGRVFSGTIRPGDTLRALRTDGSETKAKIAQIKLCGIGGRMITIPLAEAGQLVALEGVDEALRKAGTLTSAPEGYPIRHMNFAVTPVLQHSVRPIDTRNLTKMVAAFHQVVNADATALFFKDQETQEYILAGTGELHIEVLVSTFMQDSGIDVELSEPTVAYREGLRSSSAEAALAKSDNKHNRVWIKASPLSVDLVTAMNTGSLAGLDAKALAKELVAKFGWSRSEASRIWAVGPEPLYGGDNVSDVDRPTCMLVDSTFGLQIPDDAKSNIVSAFKQVVRQGVLVNAPMQGVRFDLIDAKFHTDSVHRRPNSVVPAAARAMKGAFLMAEPSLMEPLYKVDVTGSQGTLNSAYSILGQRGGVIVDATSTPTSDLIQALVPVRRAFGIAGELRLGTHGHAHTACLYSGMRMVPESEQGDVIVEARLRKNLAKDLPKVTDFVDKL
jgi:elongation factor 2